MNPRNLTTCLALLLAFATSASAEIIGVEQFDYADGAIATKSGGTFWDYKNFTPTGHTGTASTWDNFTGAPVVTSGRLVTDNSSAKREYNGALESDGAVNDPASVPSSVAHSVYYRVTFTTGATLPSFISISSSDFGTDIVSFGVSMDLPNDNKFSFRIHPLNFIATGPLAAPNTTYTLVAKLDYVNNVASLWLNPDFNAAENAVTPLLTFPNFTPTNWSTAVRLASGTGGAVTWDDLAVATAWDDLGTVVTTTADEDVSLNPASGTGVSLREAVKYSPTGTLVTFAPALSGKTITLTLGVMVIPGTLTVDASSLPQGLTIDGNRNSRLFSVGSGRALTLRSLTLTGGNGVGGGLSGEGGAIRNLGGSLQLTGCTLTGNSADQGGAIFSATDLTGRLTSLTRCTLTGNSATVSGGALSNGGGRTTLTACTVSGNSAPSEGGGLASLGDANTETVLTHTIVSANAGGDVQFVFGGSNSFTSQGHNLIGDGNGVGDFIVTGDQTGVTNPKLTPLGYFGGPTMTMHPLIGSPAIDMGSPVTPGVTDQRGFPGIVDGNGDTLLFRDIGAVEAGPLVTVTSAGDGGGLFTLRGLINFFAVQPGLRIGFNPSAFPAGNVTLNGTEISIPATASLFIDASNLTGPVTVSGSNVSRIFNIPAGASAAMHGLAILNGKALDGANSNSGPGADGAHGGGILNNGALSLFSCSVANGRSGNGGTANFGTAPGGKGGNGGGIFSSGPLGLASCTVSGNQTGGGGGSQDGAGNVSGGGGGIFSTGPLTLTACTVSGNATGNAGNTGVIGGNGSASGGGGGILSSGPLSLTSCSVSGNQTGNGSNGGNTFAGGGTGSGGGISGSDRTSLLSCTVTGNRTANAPRSSNAGDGGGVSSGGPLTLVSCAFSGNQTGNGGLNEGFTPAGRGGNGGGIAGAGPLSLTACTLSGNITGSGGTGSISAGGAGGSGGGIFSGVQIGLTSCTISGNTTGSGGNGGGGGASPGGAGGGGGGILGSGPLSLTSCTVAANAAGPGGIAPGGFNGAGGAGGGVNALSVGPTVQYSVVAKNIAAGTGPDFSASAASFPNKNFMGNTGGFTFTGTAPLTGDPLLAPLGDYGGPTFTMALKPASPARETATGSTRTADQRGFPIVGIADLGAYEAGTLTNFNNFIYETLPAIATDAQHLTTADFDGDGANNLDEWLALTDAANPASVFRVTSTTRNGTIFSVTFPTVLGRNYLGEFSIDLIAWTPLTSVFAGTGNPIIIPANFPSATKLFIRARVGP